MVELQYQQERIMLLIIRINWINIVRINMACNILDHILYTSVMIVIRSTLLIVLIAIQENPKLIIEKNLVIFYQFNSMSV